MDRKLYKIDATDKVLGRLATDIAWHLMGKHRADYQAHIDSGDVIEVSNVSKIKITGKKLDQKEYYHHSQYPGGLKTRKMSVLMETNPAEVLRLAVSRMLPKTKHRTNRLKRLNIS
ncbi:50S ribosomal protein L13 [Candidatus Uhrbacteria bacterium]|jgi:large subunit ribosomal protein L13|nr:50S ribosomal protein L13 [Candidatus Uhrbacteria bacterium]